ncbi:nucleotidyl transferase family protein, partial [Staphylococcus epidermidis]
YSILINFSSTFPNLTSHHFIKNYIINNHVKGLIPPFHFTFPKFPKPNITVLHQSKPFNTTILPKQHIHSQKISTTPIPQPLTHPHLHKPNHQLPYIYTIKPT